VGAVARDRPKAELAVERDGLFELRQGVELHLAVAALSRRIDGGDGQCPAEAGLPRGRVHVEPLHLAGQIVEPPEPHAADCGSIVAAGNEQRSFGRRIVAG
jgi:hypothetical protein